MTDMLKTPSPSDTAHATRAVVRLDEVVMRHARQQPGQPALSQDERSLDYKALAQSIDRACARLQAWGIGNADRVACLGWNSIEVLVLLLALARLGAMLAPLNHRLAAAEWDQLMQDCTPRCLLHDEAWVSAAQALGERHGLEVHTLADLLADIYPTPVTTSEGSAAESEVDWTEALGDPRPVLLVYTSGTTGQPRAAVHTQANLIANMQAASQVLELGAQDRVLTMLPLFHVGGLCIQTLPALWAGAQVRVQARFDPEDTLLAIERYRIGYTVVVPAVMKALLEHPRWQQTDLSSLRGVSAGSSTLPMHLVQGFLARGVPLGNVYGATETGPFSIAFKSDPALALRGSCGWPAPGLEARLGPLEGGAAGSEDTGEVWLRGPAVVRHYWPDRPAVDSEGWFHSGDVARVDQDGSWTIVGRSKDMIISGGENIYPAEIEGLLAQHPAVVECAVLGVPDERWGESVVAVVVLHPQEAQASDEDLLVEVRARLARYKQPRRVVRVLQLPKTALGKVQKSVLRETLNEPGTPAPP